MKKVFIIAITAMLSVSALAAMLDSVDVSVTVGAGSGSFLTVEPAAVSFGTVNPSPTTHRYASNILTCEFYAANAPWSVEVTADNPQTNAGLVATVGSDVVTMPLKFWTANYGGVGDPTDDTEWTGNSSVFRWVLDEDDAVVFKLGSSAEFLASPTPFKFGIDAEGAYKTNYSSQVTFELVIE